MATIITQPTGNILTINEPVLYEFQEVLTGITTNPSALEVHLEFEGVLKDLIYIDAFSITRATNTTCVFKMNVAEMLKKHITNQTPNFLSMSSSVYSIPNMEKYRLKITPYLPDTEGVLVRSGSSIYTDYKYITSIYLKENETLSDLTTFLTATSNRQFLTASKRIDITRSQYRLLAYVKKPGVTDLVIRFYNGASEIGTGIIDDIDNTTDNKFVLLNISVSAIASMTFTATIGDTDIANADRFRITLSGSETIEVTIVEPCHGYRLHFLNRFGFFDSVTLKSDVSNSLKTKSSGFEKVKTAYNYHSKSTLQKTGVKQFEGYATNLTAENAAWLEDLLMSPIVYLEQDGAMLPVIVEDDTNELKQTGEMTDFRVRFYLSNNRKSQRN